MATDRAWPAVHSRSLDHQSRTVIQPSSDGSFAAPCGCQHPALQAAPSRPEPLQPINRRQVPQRIAKGHQFSLDQIPVPWRVIAKDVRPTTSLGFGIAQGVIGAVRQKEARWHCQRGVADRGGIAGATRWLVQSPVPGRRSARDSHGPVSGCGRQTAGWVFRSCVDSCRQRSGTFLGDEGQRVCVDRPQVNAVEGEHRHGHGHHLQFPPAPLVPEGMSEA